jgi:hypothetical protein
MTPKQKVLELFQMACMGRRKSNGMYAIMQSAISWGEPVGGDGKSPREAWTKAAANLPNWRKHFRQSRRRTDGGGGS